MKLIDNLVCDKYVSMLLCFKVKLDKIPENIRLNINYWKPIHAAAFRADRAISEEQYLSDICLLSAEIDAIEDTAMKKDMEVFCRDVRKELSYFEKRTPEKI